MIKIIFEVTGGEVTGVFSQCTGLRHSYPRGVSRKEICHNIKEAVDCYFGETMTRPELTRLHFVRGEDPVEHPE